MGPTLLVDIGFDPDYRPDVEPHVPPKAAVRGLPALVDTGATESCIDASLAGKLNLPIVNRQMIAGAHGAKEVNVYLAQINISALGQVIYGAFAGVDLLDGGQQHHALIGRTFLQNFTMTYEGKTGTVIISS